MSENLAVTAEKLSEYPDLQSRMLLFRSCFCTKPIHIFRTIGRRVAEEFIVEFECIKKKVLDSIFGMDNIGGLGLGVVFMQLFNLPIGSGGLGLTNSLLLADVAYIASAIDHHNRNEECYAKLCDVHDANYEGLATIMVDLVDAVNRVLLFCPSFNSMEQLLSMHRVKGESVQHQIMQLMNKKLESIVEESMITNGNNHALGWWNSQRNNEAGKWLEQIPVYEKVSMTALEFRSALRYRYFLRMEKMVNGLRCDCGGHPSVDAVGSHIVNGCAKHGFRSVTHDAIVQELNSILHYCGLWTKTEERGLFHANNPEDETRHIRQ